MHLIMHLATAFSLYRTAEQSCVPWSGYLLKLPVVDDDVSALLCNSVFYITVWGTAINGPQMSCEDSCIVTLACKPVWLK